MLTVLAVLIAIVLIASAVHRNGEVHAVAPDLAVTISNSATWYEAPRLVASNDDRDAVYVLEPAPANGDRFAAVRIDTITGSQRDVAIGLGPATGYKLCQPAPVTAEVRGVHVQRPAFHVMSLPDGKGAGFHLVDSATGKITVEENGTHRSLLTRNAFNSSSAAELLSLVSADPDGRWIAALSRDPRGWNLYLFRHSAASRRACLALEEL
jgi:hypothetical protein